MVPVKIFLVVFVIMLYTFILAGRKNEGEEEFYVRLRGIGTTLFLLELPLLIWIIIAYVKY